MKDDIRKITTYIEVYLSRNKYDSVILTTYRPKMSRNGLFANSTSDWAAIIGGASSINIEPQEIRKVLLSTKYNKRYNYEIKSHLLDLPTRTSMYWGKFCNYINEQSKQRKTFYIYER